MILNEWAICWRIPDEAIKDLRYRIGVVSSGLPSSIDVTSEAGIQSRIRLEASRIGARLWRNNVGATYTKDGAFIRYGLANESSQVNNIIKSADLIGIKPVIITPYHVGLTIGQFVSREVKASNWRYSGTKREVAQLRWAELIISLGGDAAIATGEGTLCTI